MNLQKSHTLEALEVDVDLVKLLLGGTRVD